MEDEPLPPVEEAAEGEVAIAEVEERPQVERQPVVAALEPQRPLVGGAEEARRELPDEPMLAPLVLLAREGVGVAQVLFEVEEDRVLLLVPFLERRPQPRRP